MKNILVIGATSAIAIACCKIWAGEKSKFYLVGRSADKLQQTAQDLSVRGADAVKTHILDLNILDKQPEMLEACFAEFGHIDVVLIAYGSLPDQKSCQNDSNLSVQEFICNGLSVISLLTILANKMELQGNGTIAVISSVAGDRGRPSNYLYGSAKAAVSTFCEGLRARMCKAGVHVLTVKPGFVDTPMTKGLPLPAILVVSAEKAAQAIHRAINKGVNVAYVPWFWFWIMLLIKSIPASIFKKLDL